MYLVLVVALNCPLSPCPNRLAHAISLSTGVALWNPFPKASAQCPLHPAGALVLCRQIKAQLASVILDSQALKALADAVNQAPHGAALFTDLLQAAKSLDEMGICYEWKLNNALY